MSWRDKVATGEALTSEEAAAFSRETGIPLPPRVQGSFRFKVELAAKVTDPGQAPRDLGIIGSTENGTIIAPAAPAGA